MKIFLLIICICISLNSFSQSVEYIPEDSLIVEQLLKQFNLEHNKKTNHIIFFAKKFIGLPYVGQTLDKNNEEKLIINLRQFDCTTFVESVMALALCHKYKKNSFHDYCNFLKYIRYKNGKIDYISRQHYFTEWIIGNNKNKFVEEIIQPKNIFRATQKLNINFMSKHFGLYPMLMTHKEWIKNIEKNENKISGKIIKYIPKSDINNYNKIINTINDGDIIAIVTRREGLDISHVGFAIWKDKELHLLNASSLRGKVVEEKETLYEYMKKQQSQLGIRIIRPLI